MGIKDIQNKINSVKSTQKITKAMEMVAISKMRKTETRMRLGRPYCEIIKKVIHNVVQGNLEYKHSYLEHRNNNKKIGIIVISTDRGLCGSLNTNLFKQVLLKMKEFTFINISCDLILFGLKSLSVFKLYSSAILAQVINIGENPDLSKLIGSIQIILEKYQNNKIDKIFIAYNKFHNKLSQYPIITQLLPLSLEKNIINKAKWDYLYEPESKLILDTLFDRYIESQVYQSILENIASEQAARMVAMKTATDNSSDRIQELQLIYNKVRQSNITQELTEIIAGSSAISIDQN